MKQRWALVLGVSCGTGAAIAREAVGEMGLGVYGIHRGNHAEHAAALGDELQASGLPYRLALGDGASQEAAREHCQRLRDEAGAHSVSLLAHTLADASVGTLLGEGGGAMHPKQLDKTFTVMAHSFVYWVQAAVEFELFAPNASVLAFTNPFVDTTLPGFGAIGASKAALEAYVRHLAFELAPHEVRVNIVKFGLVETPAVRRSFSDDIWEHVKRRIEAASPAPRICTADEVAKLVTFLVQDGARWFNGSTIDFTGAQSQAMLNYILTHS